MGRAAAPATSAAQPGRQRASAGASDRQASLLARVRGATDTLDDGDVTLFELALKITLRWLTA